MNYTKLKHADKKISDFDFDKASLSLPLPIIDIEKMWREKVTNETSLLPKNYKNTGTVSNKEQNNLLRMEKMKKQMEFFKKT